MKVDSVCSLPKKCYPSLSEMYMYECILLCSNTLDLEMSLLMTVFRSFSRCAAECEVDTGFMPHEISK